MKVLFVLPNIAVGGVERVRLMLMEHLSARGIECRLALRQCRGELLGRAFGLAPVDELAPRGLYQFVPSLVRLIKREQPTHIVTAFPDVGILTWLALRLASSRAKWIHTVDVTDAVTDSDGGILDRLRFSMRGRAAGFVHRRVDAVVAVSEGVHAELTGEQALDPRRVAMLYNPVVPDVELGLPRAQRENGGPCRIVAVGRLTPQKGFDILVNAMARVRGSWQLAIWGDGAERPRLTRLVAELGLQDRIQLCGYAPDPFRAMRDADVFVMPSRYEGFGNVLVEALACQCQIVATDCPHGPREILQDGRLGELVPVEDADAMAAAIERVMSGQRRVNPEFLLDRARGFSVSKSGNKWELLLHRLAAT
ncbi:glycosyltransferase [Rhodanobacter sp. A1T4]|uniref:glycosyltransferase n=1 Tax=Rhodanobacter sp. A1T4 TaxID=2723087 RepID=UPI00160C0A42|nr:glycosyltransferase [Rhodanobacter sp. A1T4]MBB6245468.1 glycosyltransferase involved in cell wall biosynthesis [Rhodanobacter sp. A1T4]